MRCVLIFLIFFSSMTYSSDHICSYAENVFLYQKLKKVKFLKRQLHAPASQEYFEDIELVKVLVLKNPELLFYQNELQMLKVSNQLPSFRVMDVFDLTRVFIHPNYHTYSAHVKYRVKGEVHVREAIFRTNNKVLLPYPRQRLKRSKLRDYVVYRDSNGEVDYKDFTLIVIESLDELSLFSRGMAHGEVQLWRDGRLGEITSIRNSNGTEKKRYAWRKYKASSKTHFALKGFDFYGKPHVDFYLPKNILLKLYEKDFLRITPYTSSINIPVHGMPKESRTSFGVEVEFIVYTLEGRRELLPFIRDGIKAISK